MTATATSVTFRYRGSRYGSETARKLSRARGKTHPAAYNDPPPPLPCEEIDYRAVDYDF